MSHPDKRTKRRGFFFPLQQEESTHRSFLSLPLSFFSPLRFLSCRGIILCLLTPLQPQTCQHELTGWKRKKNIYPQHFCDLLHCHCGCDLSGPVTYFSSNLSVTQMMPSQQTRNSALCKFAGKTAKGKTSKDASPPCTPSPPAPVRQTAEVWQGADSRGGEQRAAGGRPERCPPCTAHPCAGADKREKVNGNTCHSRWRL